MSDTAMFSSRWRADDVPGISRTFGRKLSSHASGDAPHLRAAHDRVTAGERRSERKERHERDAPRSALVQDGKGAPVRQVHGILHAGDIGDRQRVQQVLTGDVAEADPPDEAAIAGVQHRRQLIIELLAGLGVVHEAQVDRGKVVDRQAPEVVLDSLRELSRCVEPQYPA
jgi:hypothetical protein